MAGSTGTASAIRVYVGTRSRATRIMVALYSTKQGRPAQRLTSGSTSQIRQGAWNTVDIAPTRLRRGREYWLAVLGRGGALVVHEGRRGSCGADSGSAHGLGALPSSWNGRSTPKDCSVSGYVIGRASSGGPTATGTSGGGTGGVLSTNPGGTSLPNPPVTVPNPPGVPILAPHNTTAPSVSGSAVQGDTLTASSGSWTGSLSSYAYQWQDCSSSGTGCASIGGATRATYVLAGGEVGHEVRVVVTAVNGFGSTAADSGPSAVVTAAGPTQSANCFASPAACGFPDPHAGYPSSSYVGPQNGSASVACSSLTPASGTVTLSTTGATYSNVDLTGRIVVTAANVTIDNVCVSFNGGGQVNSGVAAVQFRAAGGTIENSVVAGANATNQSTEVALQSGVQLTADHDYFYNCGECVHSDGTTLENSYVITNGTPCQSGYSGSTCEGGDDHFEDIYCDTGSETVNHNTLLNPHGQTAVVFCNTNNGGASEPCANRLSITNNLMAGGGFVLSFMLGRILAGQFDVDVHWQSHRSLRGDRDVPAVDWGQHLRLG